MKSEIRDLDRIDLGRLRDVAGHVEERRKLKLLEGRRQRLKKKLEETEKEIRATLGRCPEVLEALAVDGRRPGPPARRQRGWVQDQVRRVLVATDRPLTPAEIRDRIAKRHPREATKSLYLAVFQHLRRHDEFEQDGEKRWRMVR